MKKKPIIQHHHISYNPEWIVPVFKGEHLTLTRISWRKNFSVGFFTALEEFIRINKPSAINLDQPPAK